MVVLLKPSLRKASRSFVIPDLLRLEPIHIHNTPGFAFSGGCKKRYSGSSEIFCSSTLCCFLPVCAFAIHTTAHTKNSVRKFLRIETKEINLSMNTVVYNC